MPFNSPNYRMADHIANGHLDEILAAYMAEGISSGEMVRRLGRLGIEASVKTVQNWCDGVPAEAAS